MPESGSRPELKRGQGTDVISVSDRRLTVQLLGLGDRFCVLLYFIPYALGSLDPGDTCSQLNTEVPTGISTPF